MLGLKDPLLGYDSLSRTSSESWGGSLEPVAFVLTTQKQEKLSINN